jgi:hypothetical protein
MAYADAIERCYVILEAATPATEAPRRFHRVRGRASVAAETGGVAATSGAFRRIEIVPGASRRGTAVSGTGPKQIAHDLTLVVLYPDTADPTLSATVEGDLNLIRSVLEDFRRYAFTTSSLQNVRVGSSARIRRDGNYQLQIALIATYIGAH